MPAIECRNLGIRFTRGSPRTRARAALRRLLYRADERSAEAFTWALRGVDLTVPEGTCLGVCGVNGAGKTTLMRILCGIYQPDEGRVSLAGSATSMLSLGAGIGFNLSGRRNVYVAGAVRGLTRRQIDDCYERVREFAELDPTTMQTPVRAYSTGMRARLSFAISTVMVPDILLVDEVLSVGDAGFREKSAAHLKALTKEARCVVVSSHDLSFLRRHCDHVIWLHEGRVMANGGPDEVLDGYLAFLRQRQRQA